MPSLVSDIVINVGVRLTVLAIWDRTVFDYTWDNARVTHRTSIKTFQTHIHPDQNNNTNNHFDSHLEDQIRLNEIYSNKRWNNNDRCGK